MISEYVDGYSKFPALLRADRQIRVGPTEYLGLTPVHAARVPLQCVRTRATMTP